MKRTVFVVYDMRAAFGDTEDAAVLVTAGSVKEARRDIKDMFGEGVIYEHIVDDDNVSREQNLVAIVSQKST
jgi:hypothetical protein